ncbi:hypothetical protein D9M68_951760 [compost metagenome]
MKVSSFLSSSRNGSVSFLKPSIINPNDNKRESVDFIALNSVFEDRKINILAD